MNSKEANHLMTIAKNKSRYPNVRTPLLLVAHQTEAAGPISVLALSPHTTVANSHSCWFAFPHSHARHIRLNRANTRPIYDMHPSFDSHSTLVISSPHTNILHAGFTLSFWQIVEYKLQ